MSGATSAEHPRAEHGSVTDRTYSSVVGGSQIATGEDHYSYSYRELPWKYVSGDPTQNDHEEWRYRYNAMGEREQKRLYWGPLGDEQPNNAYPWEYYLVGGHREQLSVWQGQQTSLATCDSTGRRVYMYPTEYLSYGVGSSALVTTRANGAKEYKIVDHLGSTRGVVYGGGNIGWLQDYDPYGQVLGGAVETRKGYIDKERDRESGTHNHGVRQYEPEEGGRFLSVDVLWEKYRAWSPYVYSMNTPLSGVDPDGQLVIFVNGYRFEGGGRKMYNFDKLEYWGGMDRLFKKRIGDYNSLYANGQSGPFTAAFQRYGNGIVAGNQLIEMIKSGQVVMKKGESIKFVAHSQGSAYAAGMAAVLIREGYVVEVMYNIAPKQPEDIKIPDGVQRVVQYSNEGDIIAPQSKIPGNVEWVENVNLLDEEELDLWNGYGHTLSTFGDIFYIPPGQPGCIMPQHNSPHK